MATAPYSIGSTALLMWRYQNCGKEPISRMAEDLDQLVDDFLTRPLTDGLCLYVSCDALVMKVREGGRVNRTSVLVATGVNNEGFREILGMHIATSESKTSWLEFFRTLHQRGLTDIFMLTSDAHLGIQHASGVVYPTAYWQRCRTHFTKNLSSMVPKTQWPMVSAIFHTIFKQPDSESVKNQATETITYLEKAFPTAADYIRENLDDPLAFTNAPKAV